MFAMASIRHLAFLARLAINTRTNIGSLVGAARAEEQIPTLVVSNGVANLLGRRPAAWSRFLALQVEINAVILGFKCSATSDNFAAHPIPWMEQMEFVQKTAFVLLIPLAFSQSANAQRRSILLTTQPNGGGASWVGTQNTPVLPPNIDAKAQTLSVIGPPIAVYDGQNYTGQRLTLINSGGCNNLANCMPNAGNWANRIRSVQFLSANDPLAANGTKLPGKSINPKSKK
jgi:hypothetical protein